MLASIRPYFTAGATLVGAGVIAVTPIHAAPADVRIVNPAVEMAAIPSPFELYPQVIASAVENAKVLTEGYFLGQASVVSSTVEIQFAALADAFTALEAGESAAFLTEMGDAVTQPVKSLAAAVEFIAPVLRNLGPGLVDAVTGPLELGYMATVAAIVDVVEAALAFDLIGTFNAVVNIPARIIDGVLNGEFDSTPGHLPGLLEDRGGLIAVVAGIDREIGVAIKDAATSADDELPDLVAGAATSTSDPAAAGGGESVSGESDAPAEDRDAQAHGIEADSDIDDDLVAGEPVDDEVIDEANSGAIDEADDEVIDEANGGAIDEANGGAIDEADSGAIDGANSEASEPQVGDDTEVALELDELTEDAVTEELEKDFGATARETAADNLTYADAVSGSAAELVDVDEVDVEEVDAAAEDGTAPTSDLAA
ncbi:MAG: hypothetical protein K0U84_03305 [Actinomycetia bacterium]|nr:hypothetical protein [Actinomycetes bacterium]